MRVEGVAEADFWELTPRLLVCLVEAREQREKRQDFRFGVLASVMANLQRDAKTKSEPWAPADFFGSLAEAVREMDDAELYAAAERITAALGAGAGVGSS